MILRPSPWILGPTAAAVGALLIWALLPERTPPGAAVEVPEPSSAPATSPTGKIVSSSTAPARPEALLVESRAGESPAVRSQADGSGSPMSRDEPPAARPADVDWERIPLDTAAGESLGDVDTRRAFARGVMERRISSRCVEQGRLPPGIDRIDMQLELRVRSVDDALVVEKASVLESTVGSAELEACVVAGYDGLRVASPGIQPGRAYRLRWGSTRVIAR